MGHTHSALALRTYAQAMRRDDGERERLRALVEGAEWAQMPRPTFLRRPNGLTSEPGKWLTSSGFLGWA
jgi:hypothetical protein